MTIIKRNFVSIMLFSNDGKLLIGKKGHDDVWQLPEGEIHGEETSIQAIKREVLEQVGIDISSYKIEIISQDKQEQSESLSGTAGVQTYENNYTVFTANIFDKNANEIIVNVYRTLTGAKWVDLKDLVNYKYTPGISDLFVKHGYLKP